jgi:putative oxidoreductase
MGRLLLRAALGAVFVVHGSQKLLGWFGGYGPDGTGQFFESVGLRPGRRHALLAGATEVGSGVMLAAGAATPAAAAGVTGVMISALRTVVWKDGVRPATGEFEVLLAIAALTLAEEGPGPWSIDAALGQERTGAPWALGALAAGAIGSGLVAAGSRRPESPTPGQPPAPEV